MRNRRNDLRRPKDGIGNKIQWQHPLQTQTEE